MREWQLIEDRGYLFGRKVRGIVRKPCARVYRDAKNAWQWVVFNDQKKQGGTADGLVEAIEAAELVLAAFNQAGKDRQQRTALTAYRTESKAVRVLVHDLIEHGTGTTVLLVREMPSPVLSALAHYMGRGEAESWNLPDALEGPPGGIDEHVLHYCKDRYGDEKYGYTSISTNNLAGAVMQQTDMREDYLLFSQYHDWFVSAGDMPDHDVLKAVWPVILASAGSEVLEDGWHRLHDYYRKELKFIPCLYFVDAEGNPLWR